MTRAQLATILYRLSGGESGMEQMFTDIYDRTFTDAADVPSYARAAVYWAVYQEIWCGTELGFGVDSGLQDKTIDKITYYLNDGTIQTIAANIKVPKSTQNVTATVENALNTAREAVVTV